MQRNLILLVGLIVILGAITLCRSDILGVKSTGKTDSGSLSEMHDIAIDVDNPLSIASFPAGSCPESYIVIEETLPSGSNYG